MNEHLQWIQTVIEEIGEAGRAVVICTRLESSLVQILNNELIKESFGMSSRVQRMGVVQKVIVTCPGVKIARTEVARVKVASLHTQNNHFGMLIPKPGSATTLICLMN